MKPRSCSFVVPVALMTFTLVTIGACDHEEKKHPTEGPRKVDTRPVQAAKPKQDRVPDRVTAPPQPIVGDTIAPKTPDKSSATAVELGRSSVTQAEEPEVWTP